MSETSAKLTEGWLNPLKDYASNPEEVAKVVRFALAGNVPELSEENAFMREYASNREPEDAVYVGRSVVRKMEFPWSDLYTPEGYRNLQ